MDPWQLLGIDATATYDEANQAYKVRLQLRHPDRHQGASQAVLDEAERETRELNEAWDQVKAQINSGARPTSKAPPEPSPPPSPPRGGSINFKDLQQRGQQLWKESRRLLEGAEIDADRLAAHRLALEAVRLQLTASKAFLDQTIAEGVGDHITQARGLVSKFEELVTSSEQVVTKFEQLVAAKRANPGTPQVHYVRCVCGNRIETVRGMPQLLCTKCRTQFSHRQCKCGGQTYVKRGMTGWKCTTCQQRNWVR